MKRLFSTWILIPLILCSAVIVHPAMAIPGERIDICLREVDGLFAGYYIWLADMYDPATGGFYYATSCRSDTARFAPDIESTAQAFSIIRRAGLIDEMPRSMRDGLVRFMKDRQDPETGCFFDAHTDMRNVQRLRDRALSYARGVLRTLGASPDYPLPGERSQGAASGYLGYLESPAAFTAWLDERPWDYAWMGVDHIWSQVTVLKTLPEKRRDTLSTIMFSYLESKQDPQTGFWGGGEPYVRVSGAFKAVMIYNSYKKPVPMADTIFTSTLSCMRTETAEDFCWVRNPVDMSSMMRPSMTKEIPPDTLAEFVELSVNNMKAFLRPDGGFSRGREHSLASPNEVPLGMGLVEGDMNAGTQATTIRDGLYRLAGRKALPLPERNTFYRRLRETGKIK